MYVFRYFSPRGVSAKVTGWAWGGPLSNSGRVLQYFKLGPPYLPPPQHINATDTSQRIVILGFEDVASRFISPAYKPSSSLLYSTVSKHSHDWSRYLAHRSANYHQVHCTCCCANHQFYSGFVSSILKASIFVSAVHDTKRSRDWSRSTSYHQLLCTCRRAIHQFSYGFILADRSIVHHRLTLCT